MDLDGGNLAQLTDHCANDYVPEMINKRVIVMTSDRTLVPVSPWCAGCEEPRYLAYEGVLTDASGSTLNGEYEAVFRIYDSPSSQVSLWEERHRVVVESGEFRVVLGSQSSLGPLGTGSYYIGVFIEGEELLPRRALAVGAGEQTLGSVPTGTPALPVPPHLAGFFDSRFVNEAGDTMNGNLIVNANVGIGTMTPGVPLDVSGDIRTNDQLVSTIAAGTPPLSVISSTMVPNLNADLLDGQHASAFLTMASDYGRSGVATDLYEGTGMLTDKYVNEAGPDEVTSSGTSAPTLTVIKTTGGIALRADADGATLFGAYGTMASAENASDGPAVGGDFSTASTGIGNHYGVVGTGLGASSSSTIGSYGAASNTSTGPAYGGYFGTTEFGTGDHYGIRAEAAGSSSAPACGSYGYAQNTSSGNAYGGYFYALPFGTGTKYGVYGYENAGGTGAAVYASGDQIASGTKSEVVKTASSGHRLLYSVESSEVWFEDVGRGQLANGRAHIELDPLFLETVTIDEDHPMEVFIQLTDANCNGTAVRSGKTGFDVIELAGGKSDATFSCRVMAKRRGYEDQRFRQTDVGHDDPNLYPELRAEIERRHEEEGLRQELERERHRQAEVRNQAEGAGVEIRPY